jgi:hypothetical protein
MGKRGGGRTVEDALPLVRRSRVTVPVSGSAVMQVMACHQMPTRPRGKFVGSLWVPKTYATR